MSSRDACASSDSGGSISDSADVTTTKLLIHGMRSDCNGKGLAVAIRNHLQQFCQVSHVSVRRNAAQRVRGGVVVALVNMGLGFTGTLPDAMTEFSFKGAVLSVALGCGDVRDALFPFLKLEQRARLLVDDICRDFVTGQQTADAMAQLMLVLCRAGACGDGNFVVCDAFACVGGNALAFSRHNFAVVAMELVESRANMLLHNVSVCHASSVSVLCASAAHSSSLMRRSPHVLFLDPPWPAPSQPPHPPLEDIPIPHHHPLFLSHFFRRPQLRGAAAVVAAKLPVAFNVDDLARDITSHELETGLLTSERPFPFIFSFGAIRLFVVLFPLRYLSQPSHPAHGPPLQFCNRILDDVIGAIRCWNTAVASGPRFFDYEAGKWIALSKWRKCSMV